MNALILASTYAPEWSDCDGCQGSEMSQLLWMLLAGVVVLVIIVAENWKK